MRAYRAHETRRMDLLDGIELADFQQRAVAFIIDAVLALLFMLTALAVVGVLAWLLRIAQGHTEYYAYHLKLDSEVGKVLLAFLPGPRREKTLAGMKLKRLTPRTITSRSVLARQLASFLRTGYGWERNEGGWGWAVWPHPCSGLGTSCWRASA